MSDSTGKRIKKVLDYTSFTVSKNCKNVYFTEELVSCLKSSDSSYSTCNVAWIGHTYIITIFYNNISVGKGTTPSDSTGPTSAHSGQYYMYIEASSPRTSGNKAILSSNIVKFTIGIPLNLYTLFHM